VSVAVAFGASVLGLFPKMQALQVTLGVRTPGSTKFFYSDVAGAVLILLVLVSTIVQVR